MCQALALILGQLALQIDALMGEFEEPLAAVAASRPLSDETFVDQLAENARQALFGDAQNSEQIRNCDAGIAPDEINHPVMRPAEAVFRQYGIGLGREIAIGVEQKLHPLAELFIPQKQRIYDGFYVSHVDIYAA